MGSFPLNPSKAFRGCLPHSHMGKAYRASRVDRARYLYPSLFFSVFNCCQSVCTTYRRYMFTMRPSLSRNELFALALFTVSVVAQNTTSNNLQYVNQLIGSNNGGTRDDPKSGASLTLSRECVRWSDFAIRWASMLHSTQSRY